MFADLDTHDVLTVEDSDHDLGKSLAALNITTTPRELGPLFRSLRDREIGGFILLRDGTRAAAAMVLKNRICV